MIKKLILVLSGILILSGCSLQKFALRTTAGLFDYGMEAIYREPDMQLAEQATASDLKLLEGFYLADKSNSKVLLMLTQGYASYSLGFVEDESPDRAKMFYLRARDYGFDLLKRTGAFHDSIPVNQNQFSDRLLKLSKKDVPALFWTAFAWGGWINLSKDNPQAVFDLGKVKAMMSRVQELDESFFFGASYLFFGSVHGALPKMLGGDPLKAKSEFEKCLQISDNKFLLAYVYLARYYAQPTLNETLFDEYLEKVIEAPPDILPGYELITSIAKEKAQRLLAQKEDLF